MNRFSFSLLRLTQQLDDDDKHVILRMIDTMLTNKKIKDFFQKNLAASMFY